MKIAFDGNQALKIQKLKFNFFLVLRRFSLDLIIWMQISLMNTNLKYTTKTTTMGKQLPKIT